MAGILALGAPMAGAHQSPAACGTNGLALNVTKDRTVVRNGDTSNYNVTIANEAAGTCDLTDVRTLLTLPAANGTPTGRVVELAASASYPAGSPTQTFPRVSYAVQLDPGVSDAVAEARASGTLHDAPVDHAASVVKTLGTSVTQPNVTLTVTANPSEGPAPLSVTYTYSLRNESSTNTPISDAKVEVADRRCEGITQTGGDTNNNKLLDRGETWTYTCTEVFRTADTFTRTATATGTDSLDRQPVTIKPVDTTVRVSAPPTAAAPERAESPPAAVPVAAPPPAVVPAGTDLLRARLPRTTSREARPDAACISVPSRLSVRARELTVVRVRVQDGGSAVSGALVRVVGPDLVRRALTNADGVARFRIRAPRSGTLVIQSNHCAGADRVTVRSARRTGTGRVPRVTG